MVFLLIMDVIGVGEIKVLVVLEDNIIIFVDFCLVEKKVFVMILYYFMGFKDYNIKMC